MSTSDRRDFLKSATAGIAAGAMANSLLAAQQDSPDGLPKRPLGRTGEMVSILCLGGWHVGAMEETAAIELMHTAIDEGVTFFDNAWDYHDGGSEEVMGKALASGGRREKVFLMTKNCGRDRDHTMRCLEDSLRRLQTDHIDLWQFHEINYDNDPEWIFERGAIEAAIEARKQGKVRYIGFTGHKHPDILLDMLNKPFEWETVQMPINILDAQYRSFQHQVLPECARRGIGVLGMKALGGGHPGGTILNGTELTAEQCRRFALSQPISSLVCGMTSMENLRQDVGVARDFQPMPQEQQEALLRDTQTIATDGRFELFKSAQNFDGPYHKEQHGFGT
ncbi:MAG: aldo/keto reductase [Pirellulales bacterium]